MGIRKGNPTSRKVREKWGTRVRTQTWKRLLRRLRKRRNGMAQSVLALGGHVYRARGGRQRQHDGGLTRRIGGDDAAGERSGAGGEQDCAARRGSTGLTWVEGDRKIQLAADCALLLVAGLRERCGRIADQDPSVLVLRHVVIPRSPPYLISIVETLSAGSVTVN